MATRTIDPAIWDSAWFGGLSKDARLLYLFLATCRGTRARYALSIAAMARGTGLVESAILPALASLAPEIDYAAGRVTVHNLRRFLHGRQVRPSIPGWAKLRKAVFARDRHTCTYCGRIATRLQCDHIIPLSRGGPSTLDNLTTACKPCNNAKRARTPEEWLS